MEEEQTEVEDLTQPRAAKPYLSELGVPLALSATQVDMFQRCQYQYYRRYVLGEKSPPTAALAFGRADDETKNRVYSAKIVEPDETLPGPECKALFAAEFDTAAKDVEDWGKDDRGALLDTGTELIGMWREQRAVMTTPAAVQHGFEIDLWNTDPELVDMAESEPSDLVEHLPQPFLVTGVVDVVVDSAVRKFLRDHKTAARKNPDKKWQQEELQPAIYTLAAEIDPALHGVDPNYFEFEIAVKTKKPYLLEHPRVVDRTERAGMVKRLMRARRAIDVSAESGAFLPNRKSTMCSKRWCGFWEACVAEFGGEVAD